MRGVFRYHFHDIYPGVLREEVSYNLLIHQYFRGRKAQANVSQPARIAHTYRMST
jgi:hypothetical protein